jgi:short-subunit dehydrogenase
MQGQEQRRFAVVTGASSGIGFELAKVFAEEGFDLLVTAEDAEIEAAQRELNQLTASVECVRLDLSREEEVNRLYERIQATGRPVEALALNAGIGAGGDLARDTGLPKELRLIGGAEKDDPAEVARQGYEALMAGREKVVGGSFKNKAQTVAGKVIPDSAKAEMNRKMAQPATAGESEER